MKSEEFRKIHVWKKCLRCKLRKWVLRPTNNWDDLLCLECQCEAFENNEDPVEW